MNPEDTRNILMLAAVEEADEGGVLLSLKDRHEASREAGAPLPANPGRAAEERFLASRAVLLLGKLRDRLPKEADWLDPAAPSHPTRHPALVVSLLALAALAGYASNALGPDKRINILAFPLLGILAWSVLVYLRETWLFLTGRSPRVVAEAFDWFQRRAPEPSAAEDSLAQVLATAKRAFGRRWSRLAVPPATARVKAVLHLAALVLAVSAVAGMYVKGLANEYRAVWESTFLTEGATLRSLLGIVLGPAAALSGESLPTAAELDGIRGAAAEGENAARWIHWYALTIAIFVLVPRAVLAALWRAKAARLIRSLPYRETAPRYFARLLATSSGSARSVALVPYAFHPDETTQASLVRRLEDEFGAAVEAVWRPAIEFGGEEEPVDLPDDCAEIIPVFSFAATPERETHLVFHQTLSGRASNPVRFVLLEAAAFDRKSRDLADAATRRAAREEAWRRLFSGGSVALLIDPETVPAAKPSAV
jgi:hypothetical protein